MARPAGQGPAGRHGGRLAGVESRGGGRAGELQLPKASGRGEGPGPVTGGGFAASRHRDNHGNNRPVHISARTRNIGVYATGRPSRGHRGDIRDGVCRLPDEF